MIQIQEEPNSVTVKLESFEVAVAAQVGFRRALFADLRRSKPAFPEKYPGQLWYGHIAGASTDPKRFANNRAVTWWKSSPVPGKRFPSAARSLANMVG